MALKRYFEWIDGEEIGTVVTLESIETTDGETFYHFDNGDSCNLRFISKMTNSRADLKQKFMVEISSPANPWTMETIQPKKYIDESMRGQEIEIPTLHDMLQAHGSTSNVTDSDVGKQRLVPPRLQQNLMPLPEPSEFPMKEERPVQKHETKTEHIVLPEKIDQPEHTNVQIVEHTPIDYGKPERSKSYNPVHILVDSCNKHETEISMDINIMIPSRHIYNIAANEFENGAEEFIDYVVDNIDMSLLIHELKLALINAYQNVEQLEGKS